VVLPTASVKSRMPPANGQGTKTSLEVCRRTSSKGRSCQREVANPVMVQEGDFRSRALLVVAERELDWMTEVTHFALLAHVVLVPLGHHQFAPVILAYIQTCDDRLASRVGSTLRRGSLGGRRPAREIPEHAQADGSALLRMELGGHQVASLDRAHEPAAIVVWSVPATVFGTTGRMNEVELFVANQAGNSGDSCWAR